MEANNSKPLEIRHPDVSYEHRDMDHRTVFVFLFLMICGAIVIHIAVWGAFEKFGGKQYAGHQTTNPIETSNEQLKEIGGDPALNFPRPRLQPNPVADLNKFRIYEEDQLNSYGWVDPQAARIRIPIERAIDIMGSSWQQEQSLVGPQTPPAQWQAAQGANAGANQGTAKP